jgi:hypothetical protein
MLLWYTGVKQFVHLVLKITYDDNAKSSARPIIVCMMLGEMFTEGTEVQRAKWLVALKTTKHKSLIVGHCKSSAPIGGVHNTSYESYKTRLGKNSLIETAREREIHLIFITAFRYSKKRLGFAGPP